MNIQVRYFSKSGHTKEVADAIAQELGVSSASITKEISKNTDILFLGGSIYAGKIDSELKKFILNLDSRVKKIAVFSTSAGKKTALAEIKKLVEDKKIFVYDNEFHCKGQFLVFNKERPNADDLKLAKQFAKEIVK